MTTWAETTASASFVPMLGVVTTSARMNIRRGAPSTSAPIALRVPAGTMLAVRGVVQGESVRGNADWYSGVDDTYFWSGATSGFEPKDGDDTPQVVVKRRPNGTIKPLNDQQIRAVFGNIQPTELPGGRVSLDAAWVAHNIVDLPTPILATAGYPTIRVHRKAAEPFRRVFDAIAAAGLAEQILTCAGTFVPRHKGWNPARTLSSHTWGIAIDLNSEWNGYGAAPAALGTHGSVRELVPMFEAEGFAWGGHFEPASARDGMHFELARMVL